MAEKAKNISQKKEDVLYWTEEDTKEWLNSQGLLKKYPSLNPEKLNGGKLLSLTSENMREIGVTRKMDQIMLLNRIAQISPSRHYTTLPAITFVCLEFSRIFNYCRAWVAWCLPFGIASGLAPPMQATEGHIYFLSPESSDEMLKEKVAALQLKLKELEEKRREKEASLKKKDEEWAQEAEIRRAKLEKELEAMKDAKFKEWEDNIKKREEELNRLEQQIEEKKQGLKEKKKVLEEEKEVIEEEKEKVKEEKEKVEEEKEKVEEEHERIMAEIEAKKKQAEEWVQKMTKKKEKLEKLSEEENEKLERAREILAKQREQLYTEQVELEKDKKKKESTGERIKSFFGIHHHKPKSHKPVISAPQNVKHVSGMRWDAERGAFELSSVKPKWIEIFKMAGIKKRDLCDPEKAPRIYEVLESQKHLGIPEASAPDQVLSVSDVDSELEVTTTAEGSADAPQDEDAPLPPPAPPVEEPKDPLAAVPRDKKKTKELQEGGGEKPVGTLDDPRLLTEIKGKTLKHVEVKDLPEKLEPEEQNELISALKKVRDGLHYDDDEDGSDSESSLGW